MIFLRAGGQWLFEKPASLSPSLLPSLSLALSLLHLSVFPHLPLPLPPFSPRSTVPHPPTTPPPSPDTERAVIMETSRSPPPVSPAKLCALGGN